MENKALELKILSSAPENKEVVEPQATQSLVDTVDAAIKSTAHVQTKNKENNKQEDVIDGIRKKVELKPSPLLYSKKETKRKKALTLWGKIWNKLRYALPVLLIATMIIINQSIHKHETNQKKPNTKIDYERLFQVLDRETPLLKEWQTQENVRKFYVFNWTNSDQISSYPRIKPHFEEVGPFVFDELIKKTDLVFDTNENQVSFSLDRTKEFNRDASFSDLDTKIVSPFKTHTTVKSIIYGSLYSQISYFYHQNVTSERKGRFTVFTGKDARETMNQLVDRPFNTLGDVWSSVSTPDFTHALQIYSPDVCLSVKFNDIKLTETGRFWASSCIDFEHDNATTAERCKVVEKVKRCRGHSNPLIISFPHFYTDKNYEYDESFGQDIEGLTPDKKRHRSYVRFELKTGRLLEKRMRLQYNHAYKLPSNKEVITPLFWSEEILISERGL